MFGDVPRQPDCDRRAHPSVLVDMLGIVPYHGSVTASPNADAGGLAATRRTSAQTHDHILRVAGELFYREGIRATGIDRVASQAEVAPTTLYRLFASKDELVAAYVERCSTNYRTRANERQLACRWYAP